jgi:hypothetical protein
VVLGLVAAHQKVIHYHPKIGKAIMNDCATWVTAVRPTAGESSFTRSDPSSEKNAAALAGFRLHHAAV